MARADVMAAAADMEALFMKYGEPDHVQPHNRAAFDAEMARIYAVLGDCIELIEKT
jgi:hypothetical protein